MSKNNNNYLKFFQIILTCLFLYYAFKIANVNFSEVFEKIQISTFSLFSISFLAVSIILFTTFLNSLRFKFIVESILLLKLTILQSFRICLSSLLLGVVFNTGIGADIYRFLLFKNKDRKLNILIMLFIDRFYPFLYLLLFQLIFLFFYFKNTLYLILLFFFILFYFCSKKIIVKLTKLDLFFHEKNFSFSINILLYIISFSILIYISSKIFNVDLEFYKILIFSPFILFAHNIPLFVSGFGSRELAMLYIFSNYSSKDDIFLVSFFLGIMFLITPLFGLFDIKNIKNLHFPK